MDLRIERGSLTDEELAALTAVLMARAAARPTAEPRFAHGNRHPRARWRRLERLSGYRSPVSWR
ncbi:acyl-CoA carboxylase subunit epsilon [Streptacidiphilus melanogenes]|uniref:acyl-CoA carboxylase subunit epsilon n=1 Tax=Streptacidiphilus melanogenes TaxID=411235 RepID=UPI0005A734B9|nr:acyl-CoA carboxylase subunit epsilon [Streptacidiphilus melanogenes]